MGHLTLLYSNYFACTGRRMVFLVHVDVICKREYKLLFFFSFFLRVARLCSKDIRSTYSSPFHLLLLWLSFVRSIDLIDENIMQISNINFEDKNISNIFESLVFRY